MKKVISLTLILSLALTMALSASSVDNTSRALSHFEMAQIEGALSWGCWVGIAGMAIATAGAAAATGGVGVFIIGQLGLYSATAGLVASCING